jgi:hypothetical protein
MQLVRALICACVLKFPELILLFTAHFFHHLLICLHFWKEFAELLTLSGSSLNRLAASLLHPLTQLPLKRIQQGRYLFSIQFTQSTYLNMLALHVFFTVVLMIS